MVTILVISIGGLGSWFFFNTQSEIRQYAHEYLELSYQESIFSELDHRNQLLQTTKMSKVDFFIKEMQKEALHVLQKKKLLGGLLIRDAEQKDLLNTLSLDQSKYRQFMNFTFEPWKWSIFYAMEDKKSSKLITRILWVTLLGFVVCLLFTAGVLHLFFKQFLVRQVNILERSAMELAESHRISPIPIKTKDDLGALARHLENTSGQLVHYYEQQQIMQEELEKSKSDLEDQVRQRTMELEKINEDLRVNQLRLSSQLKELGEKRTQLVDEMSKMSLGKADILETNLKLSDSLLSSQQECQLLRGQLYVYEDLLTRTREKLDDI